MKQIVRLTESDLHRIVKESVNRVLNEVEKSFPNSVPGDDDIYYPCDINPDVWDALARGDYGEEENLDLEALKELKRRLASEA